MVVFSIVIGSADYLHRVQSLSPWNPGILKIEKLLRKKNILRNTVFK
jgi:hypothetical protein